MLLSFNWLKEFVDIKSSHLELEGILTMLGLEVDAINDLSGKYAGFVVAEVVKKEKHPDADKLSVCEVYDGSENLQVVCGAPNVESGQKVVFGKKGAVVPNGGFKLEKRKIRGVESNGMICSQIELEMGEDAAGIWVLPEDATVGMSFADYYGLNDVIFEISITPNKADCLSHLGVARELAAYYGSSVTMPKVEMYENDDDVKSEISVEIVDAELCNRYTGAVIKNCTIGPSPEWMQKRLLNLGFRPINIAVDVTNYVLIEMGQPLHAFDLAKILGNKIIVRAAQEGEKFTTLDEKERTLDAQMLMICDSKRPVAIGGVMGGMNSEISITTIDILLESAFFNTSSVRKTSKKLALQSESSYRFERGVDIENVPVALMRAAALIAEHSGGKLVKGYVDTYPKKHIPLEISLNFGKARRLIGIDISDDKICEILNKLNFVTITRNDNSATFRVPAYRVDVSYDVDLIEDIARLHNYDNIEPNYNSMIDFEHESIATHLTVPPLRNRIRKYMVSNGFNEIVTQNQIDPKSAEIFSDSPIILANPLGEELSRMRTSLLPSVLKVISNNIRKGTKDLKIFEIGKTFRYGDDSDSFLENIIENEELIIAISGSPAPIQWTQQRNSSDFYDIKGIIQDLMAAMKIQKYKFEEAGSTTGFTAMSLNVKVGNRVIGTFGQIDPKFAQMYDLEQQVFAGILNLRLIYGTENTKYQYLKVSPYPGISRDLAFIFDSSVKSADIMNSINKNGGVFLVGLDVFDQFIDKKLGDNKKSLAFTLNFASMTRTLTDDDVERDIMKVCEVIESEFSGILRRS
ncbi:MAG: phenylalanine--tRNA ligase subunit beta [Candidatus Kapabacteria bacterium]|nr:phenylalanine--tRNA ligase subunit beta [Candidatus Kapabacteria bacterium]